MDVAAGMDYLHSLGVLHSDLKAANVLLTSKQPSNYDPRGFVCKVTDFGLSRQAPAPPIINLAPSHRTSHFLPVFFYARSATVCSRWSLRTRRMRVPRREKWLGG